MDIVQTILAYNAGRDPERLALKFAKMRQNPFVFLRGTAHLFHERVKRQGVLKSAPAAWCCGDMHLENFGSYKGDNRLAYFDLNDFDEAALAPAAWDPLRLLTSLWLAADELRLDDAHTARMARTLLDAYADTLAAGKAYWLERETATGPVRALLEQLGQRKRADFLARRCEPPTQGGRRRRLRIDGQRALACQRRRGDQRRGQPASRAATDDHDATDGRFDRVVAHEALLKLSWAAEDAKRPCKKPGGPDPRHRLPRARPAGYRYRAMPRTCSGRRSYSAVP